MEQETVATPEPVTSPEATQASEAEQPTDDNAPLESEQEQLEGQASVDDDSEDVEWEGKSFKAPKGIRESLLRQADYTKKTMALAEQQKAWTAEKAAHQTYLKEVGQIHHMNEQLAQYDQVDWQAWHASNREAAEAAWFNRNILKENRDNLARGLEVKAREQEAEAEREFATRVEQDLAALSKPDPKVGWDGKFTPEVKTKLETVARELGYSDDRLARADALDVKALHLMALGKEYLKQQRAAAKPQITEAGIVPKVDRGRGNLTNNPAEMDMERYAAWRAKGGGGGRR